MAESMVCESWSNEVGLTDDEWAQFVDLRAKLQGEPVACPWCIDGRFGTSSNPVSCPACDASGMTNQWAALHAPLEDERYADSEDTLLAWPLPDAFTPLRSRLDGLTVRCPRCEGSRRERPGRGRCRNCDGVGRIGALRAALYHEIRCPHCGGSGSVCIMASWGCGYCGTSGRISIDRFERYSWVEVGETHGLWPDIEIMVCEGYPEDYTRWRDEFSPRIKAEPGVNWAGIDFSRDDLAGLDLSHAHHSSCILRRLSQAQLVGADLAWADLVGAELDGVDFTEADLSGADLTGADLTGSTIE